MACLYCKVRKQQRDLGHVRKELEDDGESGSKSRDNGSFWNRERAANNASNDVTERGRRLSNEDSGRVSNKMDDDRHSLMEMDTQASASVTLPPAVITTDSSCTIQLASIPLQQLSRPVIQDFPPAFTSLTNNLSTPSAPMAAELVSNSETDGDVKIDLAGNEEMFKTDDTNRTNRSIPRFDSRREIDEIDDLGFYSELPMISPPAYTPTAPPVCNLPHLPIPEYDRHRIQDMVLYTSAPPRRRLQPNTNRDGENESTYATLAGHNNSTSTANTRESSGLNYPSPPPPILTTRRSTVARSNTQDDR
ncbi:10872_t:CDS:1 [Paraglomus brasilianum]|uniref:10872_t:CDS:1 n=1 Tax=Paraglomus brasilianum TaxID=144538 RepID=A0A9N8WHP7_9GLOM|nr:10872_t:CDS:1 [Paraglomus brasilianum]